MIRRTLSTIAASLCCVLLALPSSGFAADITLTLPSFSNGNHRFFHQLLVESLQADGHTVHVQSEVDLPQPRILKNLDSGKLTLYWLLQTQERDSSYVSIPHALTNGLIGQRIFLIPKGDEAAFAGIKTLRDLQASGKIAGLGAGWFDTLIWSENKLPFVAQHGDWKRIYSMMASKARGIDYFPRGATEIMAEAQDNPDLAIEPNLVLAYPRDFVFYLAQSHADLRPAIEGALKRAQKSGLQRKLIETYLGPSVAALHLAKRTRILLQDPNSN